MTVKLKGVVEPYYEGADAAELAPQQVGQRHHQRAHQRRGQPRREVRVAEHGEQGAPALADALRGSWTIEFEDGRFEIRREEGGGGAGAYSVAGHSIRFVWDSGVAVQRGEVFVSRWSVYRDRLSFTPIPGRTKMAGLGVEPFTRIR